LVEISWSVVTQLYFQNPSFASSWSFLLPSKLHGKFLNCGEGID
jgi:hypothetical protein